MLLGQDVPSDDQQTQMLLFDFILVLENFVHLSIGLLLGASISDEFLEKVLGMTDKGVIVALDNPEIDKSGYVNYEKLLKTKFGKQIKYFFMPNKTDKDLNDVRIREGNQFNIYDFVEKNSCNSFKTAMKLKGVV